MPLSSHARALVFAFIALVTLVADLATKRWAEAALAGGSRQVAGGTRFVLAHNPAGAWSFLYDAPDVVKVPLFATATIIALVVLGYIFLRAKNAPTRLGVALVAGGGLGNLADRVRHGYVVDFIDVSAVVRGIERHWPTFNVADVAIVAGVALLVIGSTSPASRARSSPS
jgi:signal peptidase II